MGCGLTTETQRHGGETDLSPLPKTHKSHYGLKDVAKARYQRGTSPPRYVASTHLWEQGEG